jgi:CRP/FNR family cyclic AMP-dependent transcriptional regulator
MSTSSDYRSKIQGQPLFAEFTTEEMDELLDLLDPVVANEGEVIVKQDDRGDCMYILVEGEARITHRRAGRAIGLGIIRPGDFFGEIALVDYGPRSADVIAMGPCTLLKITQATISALAGVYPTAAFKFLIAIGRILVSRLRTSNERYIDSLLFPVAGKD